MTVAANILQVEDSPEALMELAELQGWGDGLPLVPPTRDRVEAMLGPWNDVRDESLGIVLPYGGEATYEVVAVNAVLAGCAPKHFPVLCAAVRAAVQDEFNLYGISATTSPATPMVVVNGPIAKELNFNSGGNAFGPGWRSNATVGRAVRLILLNIGGGRPRPLGGVGESRLPAYDYSTQGSPAKYTFCAAENEEASPWEPLHVERGFDPADSTVTVIGADSIRAFRDPTSQNAAEAIAGLAAGVTGWGTANMLFGHEPALVIGPEQAQLLGDEGWTKADVRRYIFERARVNMPALGLPENSQSFFYHSRNLRWADVRNFPPFDSPEDLIILVIGGLGIHSAFISTFSGTRSVTKKIETSP